MDGDELLRRGRKGRRGSGVALHVRKWFDCPEEDDGDKRVECFRVRIRGKANMTEVRKHLE